MYRLKGSHPLLLLLVLALPLTGCVKYERLLKSTDTEAQYAAARDYYARGKYERAKSLLEKVLPLSRVTRRADTVFFMLSKCYFEGGDYQLAGYSFERFLDEHPTSPFCEEASYLGAYCHYLASPRVPLDQENTRRAIAAFQNFRERYPTSERVPQADEYLKELYNKLMEREFIQAKLYYRREQYKAAVVAFRLSLEKYPLSPYREEQMFLIVKSSYYLAENSVEEKKRERYQLTVDNYFSFVSEFADSKHIHEVEKYYKKSLDYLERTKKI